MCISLALFQPDIPGNTGTLLRLAACLNLKLHIIEPAGFNLSDQNLRRAGLDYIELAQLHRHLSWDQFYEFTQQNKQRLIVFTTKTQNNYYNFDYQPDDILLFGRESAGLPEYVHQKADARVTIPISQQARSLNLAISAAMAVSLANYKLKFSITTL